LSNWSSSYLVAGTRLQIFSSAGDPTAYLPHAMGEFAAPGKGVADITIIIQADDEAQADPLRRFFPPQFKLEKTGEGLSFDGREGRRKRLGIISPDLSRAEMGLPLLDRPWRIAEEEEAVREALQAFVGACLQCRLLIGKNGGKPLIAGKPYNHLALTGIIQQCLRRYLSVSSLSGVIGAIFIFHMPYLIGLAEVSKHILIIRLIVRVVRLPDAVFPAE